MTWRDNELAKRDADAKLIVRPDARPMEIILAALPTADAHTLNVTFTANVCAVNRSADVQLLAEQFAEALAPAWGTVCVHDVARHLLGPLSESMTAFCRQHDVAACLRQSSTITTLLLARANEIGFACGLIFDAPAYVALHSSTLAADEVRAQLHRREVDDAKRAAERFEALQSLPVERWPTNDRARLIADAFAGAAPAEAYVVAGPTLARIDFSTMKLARVTLTHAQPFRSVNVLSDQRLALGYTNGVYVYDPRTHATNDFTLPGKSSRGVNSAALAPDGSLVFTHGELGVMRHNTHAHAVLAHVADARNVTVVGHHVLLSIGPNVFAVEGSTLRPVASGSVSPVANALARAHNTIVAILQLTGRCVVVRDNGRVQFFDAQTLHEIHSMALGRSVRCVAAVTHARIDALLIGGESNEVQIVSQAGQTLWKYTLPEAPVMLATAGRYVVAVGASRERVYVVDVARSASSDVDASRVITLHAVAALGHRVTDVASTDRLDSIAPITTGHEPARAGEVASNVTLG